MFASSGKGKSRFSTKSNYKQCPDCLSRIREARLASRSRECFGEPALIRSRESRKPLIRAVIDSSLSEKVFSHIPICENLFRATIKNHATRRVFPRLPTKYLPSTDINCTLAQCAAERRFSQNVRFSEDPENRSNAVAVGSTAESGRPRDETMRILMPLFCVTLNRGPSSSRPQNSLLLAAKSSGIRR